VAVNELTNDWAAMTGRDRQGVTASHRHRHQSFNSALLRPLQTEGHHVSLHTQTNQTHIHRQQQSSVVTDGIRHQAAGNTAEERRIVSLPAPLISARRASHACQSCLFIVTSLRVPTLAAKSEHEVVGREAPTTLHDTMDTTHGMGTHSPIHPPGILLAPIPSHPCAFHS